MRKGSVTLNTIAVNHSIKKMYQDKITEAYQDIQEGLMKNAFLAGAMATTVMLTYNGLKEPAKDTVHRVHPMKQSVDREVKTLAKMVKSKYKHVSDDMATHVALMAKKHERDIFPKAKDLLSVAGIESSFNPEAKSKLKKDPAIGLTQIRPKVWGLKPSDLDTPEKQIKKSADILQAYHQKLGDADSALHAYNVGITNFKNKKGLNPKYVEKFKKERELYD